MLGMSRRRRKPEAASEAESALDLALLRALGSALRRGVADDGEVKTLRRIASDPDAAFGAQAAE